MVFYPSIRPYHRRSSLRRTRIDESIAELGESCEGFRLLELRGEYTSFIMELETELALLRHIVDCDGCRMKIKEVIDADGMRDDLWGRLFCRDLPEIMGKKGDSSEPCPDREHYEELDGFIDARVDWRIRRVREILSSADVELSDLQERLKNG